MGSIETRHKPDGAVTYRAKIRIKGYPSQTASFGRRTDAKRWISQTEAAIHRGKHFDEVEGRRRTLAEAIDRYVAEELPKKSRGGNDQHAQFQWWREALGAFYLANINPAMISEARDRLLREPRMAKRGERKRNLRPRSAATVARYMAALSRLFSVAIKEWQWLADNPFRRVSKPREPAGRIRFLSTDERERLLAVCRKLNPVLYTVVVVAISTGMRRDEIMSLRWEQVDFANERITLIKTKNGEPRSVPIKGACKTLLQQHAVVRRIDSDLLFPGQNPASPIEFQKDWRKALAQAEIGNFRFHDLRHTAASYLAEGSASLLEIAHVLGHKTLSMVKRYAHLTEQSQHRVVEQMNKRIFGDEH